MAFGPAFGRVFQPPFATAGAAVAAPWWNPDGVTPAANVAGWRAKGAASQAAAYLNVGLLGNPNIDPAVVGGVAPAWNAATGWTGDGATTYLRTGVLGAVGMTYIIQYANSVANSFICGS